MTPEVWLDRRGSDSYITASMQTHVIAIANQNWPVNAPTNVWGGHPVLFLCPESIPQFLRDPIPQTLWCQHFHVWHPLMNVP